MKEFLALRRRGAEWSYSYHKGGEDITLESNRSYPSRDEALEAASTAYPKVPIAESGARTTEASEPGNHRAIRDVRLLVAMVALIGLIVVLRWLAGERWSRAMARTTTAKTGTGVRA